MRCVARAARNAGVINGQKNQFTDLGLVFSKFGESKVLVLDLERMVSSLGINRNNVLAEFDAAMTNPQDFVALRDQG